jgi:protein-S-isoprenylcysteine O-methyltransferase Ste14
VPPSPVLSAISRPWALVGAGLFAVSLGYVLFSYAVTFGRPVTGHPQAADAIWNAGLFSAFALHHSIFARRPVRRLVARMVPTDLERPFYVTVASVLLMLVCTWWRPLPGIAWELRTPISWLAYATGAAGVWLTLRSAAIVGVGELSGLSPSPPAGARPVEFKTSGPYGWVRHPIYAGWCLIVFAAPVITLTRLEFAVVSTLYLVLAIPLEEATLRVTAGEAYARYSTRVRWRMVPGLY